VVERAAILAETRPIDEDCIVFSHEIGSSPTSEGPGVFTADRTTRLKAALDAYEKNIITEALARFPSIRAAARSLGISHTALLNKLRKHRIELETK